MVAQMILSKVHMVAQTILIRQDPTHGFQTMYGIDYIVLLNSFAKL